MCCGIYTRFSLQINIVDWNGYGHSCNDDFYQNQMADPKAEAEFNSYWDRILDGDL